VLENTGCRGLFPENSCNSGCTLPDFSFFSDGDKVVTGFERGLVNKLVESLGLIFGK
jgi:hypothetical protein